MANTYHQLYIQAVFAVKYRAALLDEPWQNKLFATVGNLINETGCKTLIVNGVADHVHCFIGLKPSVSVAELMKSVKAKSSKWVNENRLTDARFEWQEGYGVRRFGRMVSRSATMCTGTFKTKPNTTVNKRFGRNT